MGLAGWMCWSDKTGKWLQDNGSDTWRCRSRVWNWESRHAQVSIMPAGIWFSCLTETTAEYLGLCLSLPRFLLFFDWGHYFILVALRQFLLVWVLFILSADIPNSSDISHCKAFRQSESPGLAHTCTLREKAVPKMSRELLFSVTPETGLTVVAPWQTEVSASLRYV